jgi:hypothetical protein
MLLLLVLLLICIVLIGVGATVHALLWLLIVGIIAAVVVGAVGYTRRSSLTWRRRS